MMKYAYDYQNAGTRGWVRAEFEDMPVDSGDAAALLNETAKQWPNGTVLRLVEIADGGAETFSPTSFYGSRGPLPKDEKVR